ncbi:GSCOCG00007737001-RA-CDS [Cotesia congregata]|uniref:Similar to SMN1: Survival motor neuron protein (Bos taurus) n=1 Tax=Cotesia congregata TaxID=51543 RepID=A0A8J2HG29_COTCN|nr:GSCOCG00007737001-RA-CDS [Cotesia congregata]CAG5099523.1 Similar to SMN1: Survival motor neuron protein (Bos taurus) [Cotesia congregata]
MSESDKELFVRSKHIDINKDDDVWDDSVLIKAYDRAISLAKEEVAKGLSNETNTYQKKIAGSNKWTVGSQCRAIYSVDGQLYEATILKIFKDGKTCLVKFLGYGNTEKVELSSLYESEGVSMYESGGMEAQKNYDQMSTSDSASCSNIRYSESNYEQGRNRFKEERMTFETADHHQQPNFPSSSMSFEGIPPPPPIPSQLMDRLPKNETDALSSMLMSWYISGFHTGYYHGIKQAQKSKKNDG